tara:strand:- start:177 stop:377 length:201 start_codon:yes stop_codon:yes gene_type:complete
MLSRKYYELIARLIKENSELVNDTIVDEDGIKSMVINKEGFINDLSSAFEDDNSLFIRHRFIDKCR